MAQDTVFPTISSTIDLAELDRLHRKEGEKFLLNKYPCPMLLLLLSPPDEIDEINIKTLEDTVLPEEDQAQAVQSNRLLIPIRKSDRNAYRTKITVGRAKNNDIIIRAAQISKLHCSFSQKSPTHYRIMDMGSVNGTKLNGQRLESMEPASLTNGDLIVIWRFCFRYLDVSGWLETIQRFR
jgi:hypothetical protein